MKTLNKFVPQDFENEIYSLWEKKGFFKTDAENASKPFTIILPPPNITGHLHLGHAWDGFLQDSIIRYKKIRGYNVNWVAGTDHAGIATQTKYFNVLKQQGIEWKLIPEDKLLSGLNAWAKEQANFIHSQWKKMGLLLNYEDEVYTKDDQVNDLVNDVFIKFYNDGLIYRDYKLVNWDPILLTAISDIEVKTELTKAKMYYFKYFFQEDESIYLEVATTRPETMFADIALVINPEDKRYQKYLGKKFINPVNHEAIELIADNHVEVDFGTGVMKCTPAHDFNDYAIAKRHKIKSYQSMMNPDATLNEICIDKTSNFSCVGLDRYKAREAIIKYTSNNGTLIKIEDYETNITYSERSGAVVEPLLSKQWFVKTTPLINHLKKLINSSDDFKIIPETFIKTLNHWLDNNEDWCISRQLIWGHRLPVYFSKKDQSIKVGKVNPHPNEYDASTDVLDTWFSSGLWPVVCTKYHTDPNYFKKFYPTQVLVTAYDILFFWVARMLFMTGYLTNKIPFEKVLIHGLIRDEQNRKMSKSLNNGIDPIEVIDKYGSDSLKMFLLGNTTLGQDLRFSYEKINFAGNFLNKLWNLIKFTDFAKSRITNDNNALNAIDSWIINRFNNTLRTVTENNDHYNFNVSLKAIIDFIWNDLCSNYVEIIKNNLNEQQYDLLISLINKSLIMLHPFASFTTEKLHDALNDNGASILELTWPELIVNNVNVDGQIYLDILETLRTFRSNEKIPSSIELSVAIHTEQEIDNNLLNNILHSVKAVAKAKKPNASKIINFSLGKIFIFNDNLSQINHVDVIKEIERLKSELKRSESILNNEAFMKKAPAAKVAEEKEKYEKYKAMLANLMKR